MKNNHQTQHLTNSKVIKSTNFTTTSELIARAIIDKLISLTITQNTLTLIENQIGDYCFLSIKSITSSCLSLNFIPYDKDEIMDQPSMLCDQSTISKKENTTNMKCETNYVPIKIDYSYDNFIAGENNWSLIPMPSSTLIDRMASNANHTIRPERNTNSRVNSQDCNRIIEEKSVSDDKSIKTTLSLHKKRQLGRRPHLVKNEKEIIIDQNRPKRAQPIEFVSFDLPKESIRNNEQKEIEELRFAKLNELKITEKAKEEMMKKIREKQEMEQKVLNKQKELDKKTITLDAKGNIVEVKKVVIERLNPEFIPIASEQKELNIINSYYHFSNDNNQTKAGEGGNNRTMYNKTLTAIKNKANQVPQLFQSVYKAVVPSVQIQSHSSLAHKYQEQEKRQVTLIQSGSSFDLMKLEIGVEIHEEAKYKTGGKDFYRKYKRYSVDNFKEQNEAYKSSYENQKEMMPIIETKSNAHESSNTLSEQGGKDRKRMPDLSKGTNKRNSLNRINNDIAKNDSIHLNIKNSIKNAFDKLDLISEKEEDNKGESGKENKTNTNFFKQGGKTMIMTSSVNASRVNTAKGESKKIDEMINFNSTIMANKNWGESSLNKNRNNELKRYPVKPQMKTIEHEIGMNIIKTKLPRARCFSYIKAPLNNNNNNKGIERTASAGYMKKVNGNNDNHKRAFSITSSEKFKTINPRV